MQMPPPPQQSYMPQNQMQNQYGAQPYQGSYQPGYYQNQPPAYNPNMGGYQNNSMPPPRNNNPQQTNWSQMQSSQSFTPQ